jgi:hypothetical protein
MRFAELPAEDATMPQHAIDTFIAAFIALGRLKADLPEAVCRFGRGDQKDAILACGLLYYWLRRRDQKSVLEHPRASAALKLLLQRRQTAAAGALYAISRSIFAPEGRSTALVEAFPDEALAICREALNNPDLQAGYFDRASSSERPQILDFAVAVVGRHGSAADLPHIRKWRDHPQLARSAAKAVQLIEARAVAPGDPSPT